MAAPWHLRDMVNNSSDVARPPRQRLAAERWTGHSGREFESVLSGGTAAGTRRTLKTPPSVDVFPDRCDSPDFGGLPYARRRQGRLRPVFQRLARYSGRVLRRHAEVRFGHQQGVGGGGRHDQAHRRGQSVQGQKRLHARFSGARRRQSQPADCGRNRQIVRTQGQRLPQARRRCGRQASPGQRGRDNHRRTAGRGHEARTGGRRGLRRAAARLQIRSLQDQKEGWRRRSPQRRDFARGRRRKLPRKKPSHRRIISSMASSSRAIWSTNRRTSCFRSNSRAAPASCENSASISTCSTSRP